MDEQKHTHDDAVKALEKAAAAVLGLFALSEERAKHLMETLVEKGHEARSKKDTIIARIVSQVEAEKQAIIARARDEFSAALKHLNLATKDDIARLEKLINEKLK